VGFFSLDPPPLPVYVFISFPQICYARRKLCYQPAVFYSAVQTTYDIFAVTTCDMAEGVTGTSAQVPFLSNENGLTAIEGDMVSGTPSTNSTKCQSNHH